MKERGGRKGVHVTREENTRIRRRRFSLVTPSYGVCKGNMLYID